LASACGINDISACISAPYSDEQLYQFVENQKFQHIVSRKKHLARRLLRSHLEHIGFFGSGQRVGLVDSGWRGTSQINLDMAFGKERDYPLVFGFYFGLFRNRMDMYASLSTSPKEGVIYDWREGDSNCDLNFDCVQLMEESARSRQSEFLSTIT
jgi:hypothetical protein